MLHKHFLIFVLLFGGCLSCLSLGAQSQAGGFDYNWANYASADFGPKAVTFDTTGIRHIEHAPATGVHPRVFFGPSELPEIQNRLATTVSGQESMRQVHAYTTLLHLGYSNGGTYNHSMSYATDAFNNKRIDNAGKWDSHVYYYDLIAGDLTALDNADAKRRYLLASVMVLEAFECLIYAGQTDADTGLAYDDRADDLAKAMKTWADIVSGDPTVNSNTYNMFGGEHMALCYDLNFNSMTMAQQDAVRMALSQIIIASPRYGAMNAPHATTSNWVGLNTFELITNLAIENEAGYNATLTEEYMRAYWNFITYGWYDSGVPFEGMGKNYQMVAMMVAMAKRGYSLLGHPNVRAFGNNFLPAITQPYGGAFIGTDVWGGTGWDTEIGGYKFHTNDVIGLKWAFPNDANIDFVWRNYIEQWYFLKNSTTGPYVYQQVSPSTNGYHSQLLLGAIFAQDYQTGNWETQNANALQTESFFGPERGLGIIRSDFSEDAMLMHYHCRQDMGGHTHGDRNSFTLSALGRIFMPYTFGKEFQRTTYNSCILVNDLGIAINPKDGRKARQMGTILDFQENTDYAKIAGDATYAYTWEYDWESRSPTQDHSQLGVNGWEKELLTWNDFRATPGSHAYHNLSLYDFDHWNNAGNLERIVKRPYNPMERVYRTAAMIRGTHPFLLIVDDVKKDGGVHNYKSLLQMATDLEVISTDVNLDDCDYRADVIMGAPGDTRKLLVRVLHNENFSGTVPAVLEMLEHHLYDNNVTHRLVIESNSVAPDFKVLLYPFEDGDPMPLTLWNAAHDSLIVSIGTEQREITFPKMNGKTDILFDPNVSADIDGDGVFNVCDICPLDALDDSDNDGVCDSYDVCPNGDDALDANANMLPDECEAIELDLAVFLEGPYDPSANLMKTDLNVNNLIPLMHPYGVAPYNYGGSETLTAIPPTMVDWVLVEARSGLTAATMVDQKAGILLSDGSVRGVDGTSLLRFDVPAGGSYHFVVRHRNHLDVVSASALPRALSLSLDFRSNAAMAYGASQQKVLPNGSAALWAGDILQNLVIQITDYDAWRLEPAVLFEYHSSDINMDGVVQATDFDLWYRNRAKLAPSEVGY